MTLATRLQPTAARGVPRIVASRMPLSVLAALTVVSQTRTATADSDFTWQAPASCPSADDVRAQIAERLGESTEGAIHGIEIVVDREGTVFRARVDLRGMTVANDVRTLRATRCDELASGIALIIARVATEARQLREYDPKATDWVEEETTDVPVATVAAQVVDDRDDIALAPRPVDRLVAPRRGHRWGGGVRALGLSGVGAQPGVSIGGELSIYVRRDKMAFELAYATWSSQPAVLRNGTTGFVEVGLDVAIARVGWGPEHLPLRAWLSAEVGRMHGQGISLEDPRAGSGQWTAIGSGFAVGWPVAEHARVVGMFEVAVPVARTSFMLTTGGEAYRPSPLTARCALGFEVGWR